MDLFETPQRKFQNEMVDENDYPEKVNEYHHGAVDFHRVPLSVLSHNKRSLLKTGAQRVPTKDRNTNKPVKQSTRGVANFMKPTEAFKNNLVSSSTPSRHPTRPMIAGSTNSSTPSKAVGSLTPTQLIKSPLQVISAHKTEPRSAGKQQQRPSLIKRSTKVLSKEAQEPALQPIKEETKQTSASKPRPTSPHYLSTTASRAKSDRGMTRKASFPASKRPTETPPVNPTTGHVNYAAYFIPSTPEQRPLKEPLPSTHSILFSPGTDNHVYAEEASKNVHWAKTQKSPFSAPATMDRPAGSPPTGLVERLDHLWPMGGIQEQSMETPPRKTEKGGTNLLEVPQGGPFSEPPALYSQASQHSPGTLADLMNANRVNTKGHKVHPSVGPAGITAELLSARKAAKKAAMQNQLTPKVVVNTKPVVVGSSSAPRYAQPTRASAAAVAEATAKLHASPKRVRRILSTGQVEQGPEDPTHSPTRGAEGRARTQPNSRSTTPTVVLQRGTNTQPSMIPVRKPMERVDGTPQRSQTPEKSSSGRTPSACKGEFLKTLARPKSVGPGIIGLKGNLLVGEVKERVAKTDPVKKLIGGLKTEEKGLSRDAKSEKVEMKKEVKVKDRKGDSMVDGYSVMRKSFSFGSDLSAVAGFSEEFDPEVVEDVSFGASLELSNNFMGEGSGKVFLTEIHKTQENAVFRSIASVENVGRNSKKLRKSNDPIPNHIAREISSKVELDLERNLANLSAVEGTRSYSPNSGFSFLSNCSQQNVEFSSSAFLSVGKAPSSVPPGVTSTLPSPHKKHSSTHRDLNNQSNSDSSGSEFDAFYEEDPEDEANDKDLEERFNEDTGDLQQSESPLPNTDQFSAARLRLLSTCSTISVASTSFNDMDSPLTDSQTPFSVSVPRLSRQSSSSFALYKAALNGGTNGRFRARSTDSPTMSTRSMLNKGMMVSTDDPMPSNESGKVLSESRDSPNTVGNSTVASVLNRAMIQSTDEGFLTSSVQTLATSPYPNTSTTEGDRTTEVVESRNNEPTQVHQVVGSGLGLSGFDSESKFEGSPQQSDPSSLFNRGFYADSSGSYLRSRVDSTVDEACTNSIDFGNSEDQQIQYMDSTKSLSRFPQSLGSSIDEAGFFEGLERETREEFETNEGKALIHSTHLETKDATPDSNQTDDNANPVNVSFRLEDANTGNESDVLQESYQEVSSDINHELSDQNPLSALNESNKENETPLLFTTDTLSNVQLEEENDLVSSEESNFFLNHGINCTQQVLEQSAEECWEDSQPNYEETFDSFSSKNLSNTKKESPFSGPHELPAAALCESAEFPLPSGGITNTTPLVVTHRPHTVMNYKDLESASPESQAPNPTPVGLTSIVKQTEKQTNVSHPNVPTSSNVRDYLLAESRKRFQAIVNNVPIAPLTTSAPTIKPNPFISTTVDVPFPGTIESPFFKLNTTAFTSVVRKSDSVVQRSVESLPPPPPPLIQEEDGESKGLRESYCFTSIASVEDGFHLQKTQKNKSFLVSPARSVSTNSSSLEELIRVNPVNKSDRWYQNHGQIPDKMSDPNVSALSDENKSNSSIRLNSSFLVREDCEKLKLCPDPLANQLLLLGPASNPSFNPTQEPRGVTMERVLNGQIGEDAGFSVGQEGKKLLEAMDHQSTNHIFIPVQLEVGSMRK